MVKNTRIKTNTQEHVICFDIDAVYMFYYKKV